MSTHNKVPFSPLTDATCLSLIELEAAALNWANVAQLHDRLMGSLTGDPDTYVGSIVRVDLGVDRAIGSAAR